MPGAPSQAGRLIPLFPAKNNDLNKMFNDGLVRGTIHRTVPSWDTPVLFTFKRGSDLQPFFDYQQLNTITVKNRYPLPLKMKLVNCRIDTATYEKLNICNMYGDLIFAKGDKEKLVIL